MKKHGMNFIFILPFIIDLGFMFISCDENTANIDTRFATSFDTVVKASRGDCKTNKVSGNKSPEITEAKQECIEYDYDENGVLHITHVNALFNCCPDSIKPEIKVNGDSIIINEKEYGGRCECLCLFDVSFPIYNINRWTYFIKVRPPRYYQMFSGRDMPLEFTMDLMSKPVGHFCADRTQPPWKMP